MDEKSYAVKSFFSASDRAGRTIFILSYTSVFGMALTARCA